jgi:putative heme-binding domain-containing protein
MRTFRFVVVGLVGWISSTLASGAEPAPKVVVAWAVGPMEARVAFDRAVDPEVARRVVGESIGFGEGEKPGAVGRPGGDRGALRVAAAKLVDEGRTLVLLTDPHPREATYRLVLPVVKGAGEAGSGSRAEVAYDLGGVDVSWTETGGTKPSWMGWWPVVDPSAVREITAGSVEQERLWPLALKPGKLSLRTLVVLPKGNVPVSVDASVAFQAMLGGETTRSVAAKADAHRASLQAESTGEAIDFSMTLTTGEGPVRLRAAIGPKALPRSAFVLPWAPPGLLPSPPSAVPAEFLTGGDPARGEAVFFSDAAKCSACHKVKGKGGVIGPDLSNLAGRDRTWIYQNIAEPSASIHPDYVTHTVALKDGRIAMGVVRAEGADTLKVGDIEGKQTVLPRAELEEIRPSATSIMPVGLLGAIGEERARDLLAYLSAR